MDMQINEQIKESVSYIRQIYKDESEVGIVLGSGLAGIGDRIDGKKILPYRDIPNFPEPATPGHLGNLILGRWAGKEVVVLQGRVHFYEGYTLKGVTFPVRVLEALGVTKILLTNAAGILNREYKVGEIMMIRDHINHYGASPLIGIEGKDSIPEFIKMSDAYSKGMRKVAEETAKRNGIDYQTGVYVGVTGPNYETHAECNYLRNIGGDAVGMSTVPETIVARQLEMEVFGLSCLTNICGEIESFSSHSEVLKRVEKMRDSAGDILYEILKKS